MKQFMYKQFHFTFEELSVRRWEIERLLGFEPGKSPDPFPQLYDETISEAGGLCEIRGGYRVFEKIAFDNGSKTIRIGNHIFFLRNIVFNQIKEAASAVLFICTAGENIGKLSKQLMKKGEMVKGYIFDVIGSATVEKAMDKIQDELKLEMERQGMGITNRYSPGYCNWDVAEQHKLFSFFPENFCGVKLTPSALMDPIKSVSGVIGIGKNIQQKGYPCDYCNQRNCVYRRLAASKQDHL